MPRTIKDDTKPKGRRVGQNRVDEAIEPQQDDAAAATRIAAPLLATPVLDPGPIITPLPPPLVVQVTAPNGGESFAAGSRTTVSWAAGGDITNQRVQYTLDGVNFTPIATGLAGNVRSVPWDIPATIVPAGQQRAQASVRVVVRNDLIGDQAQDSSDGSFTIVAPDTTRPSVTVLFPNGGEVFNPGQAVTIRWTSSDNVGVVAHDVLFSADGGATFAPIVQNLAGGQTSYGWIVPQQLTEAGLVRVLARDAAGNQDGDRGDAPFAIRAPADAVPPSVQVIAPQAGQTLVGGQPFTIQWQASDNVGIVSQRVLVNLDGVTFTDISGDLGPNPRSFPWTVPAGVNTNSAVVRVAARDAAGNRGTGDSGPFTIVADRLVTITVTQPAADVTLPVGQTLLVTWTSANATNHRVQFVDIDNGAVLPVVTGLGGNAMSANFTPDDTFVAPGQQRRGRMRVYARNLNTGQEAFDDSDGIVTLVGRVTPPPVIGSLVPASGFFTQPVKILGSNLTNVADVQFGNVSVNGGFRVVNDTEIDTSVPVLIQPPAGPMNVTVTVIKREGTMGTSPTPFTVLPFPAPTIAGIQPPAGFEGDTITILGMNLLAVSSPPSQVIFPTADGRGIDVGFGSVFNGGSIIAQVPTGAVSGPVTVRTPGGTASFPFTVNRPAAPTITDFTPKSGAVGTRVTLTGTALIGLSGGDGTRGVFFRGAAGPVRALVLPQSTDTLAVFDVPTGAVTGPITVAASGGTAMTAADFVVGVNITLPPTITSLSPTSGAPGSMVQVAGTNFDGVRSVDFGGVAAAFMVPSRELVVATVPAGAVTGPVRVATPAGQALSPTPFTVLPQPSVALSASPANAAITAGQAARYTLNLVRSNFAGAVDLAVAGLPAGASASFSADPTTGTQSVLTVATSPATPPGASTLTVSATAPGVTIAPIALTLSVATPLPVPSITSFSPVRGTVGTPVAVTGENLMGATAVAFGGGVPAQFTVTGPGSLTAIVPPGALTGPISVTTPAGTAASAGAFTVVFKLKDTKEKEFKELEGKLKEDKELKEKELGEKTGEKTLSKERKDSKDSLEFSARAGDPAPRATAGRRRHFIGRELRPDLERSALRGEADLAV